MSESLYFIAVVPPEEIQEQITAFKKEIASKYGSSHALKSPPHITLHMPFKWKDKKYEMLEQVIQSVNSRLDPFTIQLKDFDFFEPRVVFVDVVANDKLEDLQKEVVDACRNQLKLDNANYKNRPFHPHVTIGFRDLKKPMFYLAMEYFKPREFSAKFQISQVRLLKHDGVKWRIL